MIRPSADCPRKIPLPRATEIKSLRGARKAKLPEFVAPQLATTPCDFTHIFAARESKRLPQEHQKPPFLISQNFSQREVGSIRLPKVQIGSNGLPRVRVQSQRFCSADNRETNSTLAHTPDMRRQHLSCNDDHLGIIEMGCGGPRRKQFTVVRGIDLRQF